MKKVIICALIAVVSLGTFTACTSDKKDSASGTDQEQVVQINIKDELAKLETEFPIRVSGEITNQDLKDVYGMNIDNIEEFALKQSMITPGIDVMGIIKAKSGNVEDVKSDAQKIIDVKKNSAYLPGEMEALENAKIVSNGDYVGIFLIQGEAQGDNIAQKASESFNNLFK